MFLNGATPVAHADFRDCYDASTVSSVVLMLT